MNSNTPSSETNSENNNNRAYVELSTTQQVIGILLTLFFCQWGLQRVYIPDLGPKKIIFITDIFIIIPIIVMWILYECRHLIHLHGSSEYLLLLVFIPFFVALIVYMVVFIRDLVRIYRNTVKKR